MTTVMATRTIAGVQRRGIWHLIIDTFDDIHLALYKRTRVITRVHCNVFLDPETYPFRPAIAEFPDCGPSPVRSRRRPGAEQANMF
jgi:hypothetical protein